MRRIVVTGGNGFLGAALGARAREAGYDVLSLDAAASADIVCDIGDPLAAEAAIAATAADAIVHLAGLLTNAGVDDPVAAVRANALGTAAVFAAAERANVSRVIFASSNAAVGPCPPGSGDATPLRPQSVYGATKAFGEHLARAMSARPDAPAYVALRFGWVYGPGRRRGWRDVQATVERVIAGERRIRYPEFAAPIDWTWIGDAAAILVRALDCTLPAFAAVNVLGDRRMVGDAMAHLQQRFPDLVAEPFAAELPPSAWGLVNDGASTLLGPLPCTRLEDGLDAMIAAASGVEPHAMEA